MRLRADYVKLCAIHIIIRAEQRVQAIDRYVKLCEITCKLCEVMCNSHNYPRVAASISPLQIATEILNF